MTSIVGVFCSDGVVIGADGAVTLGSDPGHPTIEQPMKKLTVIGEHVIVAGSGEVGLDQRFSSIVETAWQKSLFQKPRLRVAEELSRATIEDFRKTYARDGRYGALVAFSSRDTHSLCEFGLIGFQPEFKTEDLWFCSIGSAQNITDPFLGFIRRVFWKESLPSVHDGLFAVTWTLLHAVNLNPRGVNEPIMVAVLERANGRFKARMLTDAELGQHRQNVDEATRHLRQFRQKHQPQAAKHIAIPEPPGPT